MVEIQEDSLLFFLLMSTILLLVMLGFFFAFIQLYRRRQLMYKTAQKEREQEFAKALVHSQLEIRENVMRQISEELHDNIGQSLVVAKMQLSMMNRDQFPEQIDAANELLGRTLHDIRNMSKILNGDYVLRGGLSAAVKHELQLINSANKINCAIEGELSGNAFAPNEEIIVFRCIQEILGNAIKHANATEIFIRYSADSGSVTIEITDNGQGMPEQLVSQGLGIGNLSRRIELLDGKLNVSSHSGGGTKISIVLPKNQPLQA